jgi:deoxyadenosine/deoxycytidine kinase
MLRHKLQEAGCSILSAEFVDMIVWISGPTGAGKTSLAAAFRSLGFAIIQEKLSPITFQAFVDDPVRNCETLQREIMQARFEEWQRLVAGSRVAFDRSIDEDHSVFCRMHREAGFLTEGQFGRLKDQAAEYHRQMPEPDLIVFVSAESHILHQRVQKSSHPSLIVKNLDRQILLYSEWLATRKGDVLKLDNSACTLRSVEDFFRVNA